MPDHTPVLCPECQSPLSTRDEKCWSCGRERAHEEGLEQAREARRAPMEHAAADGGGREERPGRRIIERLRTALRRS